MEKKTEEEIIFWKEIITHALISVLLVVAIIAIPFIAYNFSAIFGEDSKTVHLINTFSTFLSILLSIVSICYAWSCTQETNRQVNDIDKDLIIMRENNNQMKEYLDRIQKRQNEIADNMPRNNIPVNNIGSSISNINNNISNTK